MPRIFIHFLVLFFPLFAFSQTSFSISGRISAMDNSIISGAEIMVDNLSRSSVSNQEGFFSLELPEGNHILYIKALGFSRKSFEITVTQNKDIGTIFLTNNVIELTEVVVKKKTDPLKIEPGKKTYTLANDPTIKGSNLIEVLQNVPSVNVDAEGNVSVRGNENATVLIDGKPSSITGISSLAEALKSIPADMVEKIETITNPSSKYDASGSGGIINIVLKKNKSAGLFGSVETYIGNQANAGINLNINYKKNKWNYFTTLSYQHFEPQGRTSFNNRFFTNSVIDSTQIQTGKRLRLTNNYTLRLGADYNLNDKNSFSISGIIKTAELENLLSLDYTTNDANGILDKKTSRNQQGTETNYTAEGNLGYKRIFDSDKHFLTIDASLAYTNEEQENTIFERNLFPVDEPVSQSINPRTQKQSRLMLQSDYTKPLTENAKLDLGYRGNYRKITNDIRTDVLDINTNTYSNDPFFTNSTQYNENIQALYAEFGNKYKKIAYQVGLRSELTDIEVSSLIITNKKFTYLDFFPSASINYELSNKSNLSFSYSRRIDRPNIRFLSPILSAADNNNVFLGNLALKPSYNNMVEMEFTQTSKVFTFSSAVYFSNSPNSITIVRTFDSVNNLFVASPVNIDYANRYGLDLNTKYSGIKWWKMNANFNLFQFDQKGNYNGINVDGKGFSWFGRLTSNFTLPYKFQFSVVSMYHGPNKSNNGNTKGIYSMNLGLSKDLFKDKATLTLNVNDLLNSSRRIFTNFGDNFISDVDLQFKRRQINLSFIYRFNGAKKEQTKKPGGEDGGGEGF